MRFVIAAGGTGGHLFPGVAVGEVFLARGHEAMLVISEKEIDAIATQGRAGFRIEKVAGVGLQSRSPIAFLGFLWKIRAAIGHCKRLFAEWQPAAVLGMGGFTSFAPIFAGRRRRLPTFVHESNAIPGRANRLNARFVTRVLLGFAECRRHFPKAQCEVTGTPVRNTLTKPVDRTAALAAFGLSPEKKTLLVMGGSQGASGINRSVAAALPALANRGLQAIHLTGRTDESTVRDAYARSGIAAHVAAFHHRMEEAYGAADLAIARSGAASLTELSCFGLPSVLIPYPFAADDHQTANAEIFVNGGSAVLLKEADASGEKLAGEIIALLETPGRLAAMSERSRRLAPAGAAERVADTVLQFCQPNH